MSEYDAIDAVVERIAREEQEELDRARGQHILDMAADRDNAGGRIVAAIRRAHQAKAQDDER